MMTDVLGDTLDIRAVPYTRVTKRDLNPRTRGAQAQRYFDFCNALRLEFLGSPDKKLYSAQTLSVVFIFKASDRSLIGSGHRQKPDLSNLVKAVEDALLEEDCTIAAYPECRKIWGHEDAIKIRLVGVVVDPPPEVLERRTKAAVKKLQRRRR